MNILWILLAVLAVPVLWVIFAYNQLIKGRMRTKEAWSDIQAQLKRRRNLIPNLVDTVEGYMEHEKEVLTKITEARSKAQQAEDVKKQEEAENMLSESLKSLFAVAEDYPDLKADENFRELQREITDTENKILSARRFYNNNVRDYNILIESFPSNIIANLFSFKKEDLFEIENPEEAEPVDVEF